MKKKLVFIVSSMRSGSTLLKALLATRKDVTNLPEIHFSKVNLISDFEKIHVIKAPAYYNEFNNYPIIEEKDAKIIVLIRNPYDTIISLKNMNEKVKIADKSLNYSFPILFSYWYHLYTGILYKLSKMSNEILIVRYEDLIQNPIRSTCSIFKFIKCEDTSGTQEYYFPSKYKWKWGSDDGGDVIKELKVKNYFRGRENMELKTLIKKNKYNIIKVLKLYKYSNTQIKKILSNE
ncbi:MULTISPECIES: sulfotransferase [unclassified Sphingobacterium]|uniref:sulfotransferase family protein n=1 Tax=unclassified Sphingobacterium TaxID=2609468 RepID=UPI001051F545|nr:MULTISPECIES: sulfotransferase [unclassified Sphingobacterium]MCS3556083.1 hypothetical protein [Sphingobacterium sp. JUb21]TCR08460.1 sulfotransferase domain-containing protein [Sphingobacterium sp. JUb20]